jgi:hypothetical protein
VTPTEFSHLHIAMQKFLDQNATSRASTRADCWVYEDLAEDMAKAAAAVFDANAKGQVFAEAQK